MISEKILLEKALATECKIGIGNESNSQIVIDSINKCSSLGLKQIKTYSDPVCLIDDLSDGKIDAAVRGNFSARKVIDELRAKFLVKDIIRISILKTASGKLFILAPIGIDEGSTVDEKIEIISHSVDFFKLFDTKQNIAVMSGGRKDDLNRSEKIDETLIQANAVTTKINSMGFKGENFDIRIEDAVNKSNIIIVPDGVIGNYIFRTLYHLGAGDSIGAPIMNLSKVFIDTSRTKRDYTTSLVLSAALYNVKFR